MRTHSLIITLCLITLKIQAQQASFQVTSCDTFYHFKAESINYYANPTGENQLVSLYSWSKKQSYLFNPSTLISIQNNVEGLLTKTNDVTFTYIPDADEIHIIRNNHSTTIKSRFRYKGIVYDFLDDGLKYPVENIKIRSCQQGGKSYLIIPVSPDVNLFQSIFMNRLRFYRNITRKAFKLLVIDESGKVIRGIGRYDKAYSKRTLIYADVFSFDCDTLNKRVFVTDKISGTVRVYDLMNSKEMAQWRLADSERQEDQYRSRFDSLIPEQPFQFLIEAKSTGDIFYDAKHELLFVLKTDSMKDPTQGYMMNESGYTTTTTYVKNRNGGHCPVYSDRFYKLMYAYYFDKPVIIQCYDKALHFLGQARINVPNESQIMVAENGSLLIHSPVFRNKTYVMYRLLYTIH